ncbi:hypothetical protein TcasGA2_TC000089 [Tribolium castaneum]|uniref:Uncharacterized protein n=1 Tax=Tribolium castaneum TaxID=7070 RepID=D6WIR0_TRICA|nr:PREDICTED: uncharacterized protein LOC103314680 [Tribolium castaneum]XP_008199509.1 PREDICTED: uncharacterized protein LOC103314680 [Tribolium castaneum]EEZ99508.1 hypothetical protein TcasGA2_TC000089 [Tribolium castaneum]|eukprot:XP_008199508.1 PREDICTED: uncharacterized protein LOC103314680 [Tribolium castaneum]
MLAYVTIISTVFTLLTCHPVPQNPPPERPSVTNSVNEAEKPTEILNSVSMNDLLESFGGSSTETQTPEPATNSHNGLYFLFDWNSFLEVDDQAGRRVNLRFQPKIGDPKRFISVTVP